MSLKSDKKQTKLYRPAIVSLALCILLLLAEGCTQLFRPTPSPTPSASPTPEAPTQTPSGVLPGETPTSAVGPEVFPSGYPTVVPILYKMFDTGSDYQHTKPEWGPVGSIQFYLWEKINPEPDVYNWVPIDQGLAAEASLKVTLPDGREIPKPVVIQIFPYLSSAVGWNAVFYDATPNWVYDQIDAANPGNPRPIVYGRKVGHALTGCGTTAVLPMYDSPIWREAYYKMVRAFGARYANNPQVTSVVINTGLDGETQPVKDWYCSWETYLDQQAGGVRYNFGKFINEAMAVYREAFPRKPIFINNAPGGSGVRKATSDYAATFTPPIGLKNSSLWIDRDSHQGYGNFYGMWDLVNTYSQTLPIWLESAYGMGDKEHRYWTWLAGLHYHPDAIDVHPEFLSQSDPAWLRFVVTHLGVNIQNTPDVWTVLRDAEYPLQSWGAGGVSGKVGDWFFWLYRREEAPQSATERIWREDMPAAKDHVFSRQTRRTQQAKNQVYMSFDIDDGYPFVKQKPIDVEGGNVYYTVDVTLLNIGSDTFALQYRNWEGAIVSQVKRKGPELGAVNDWVTVSFLVRDGYFANGMPGNCDFRLSCERDGDEHIHMVRVAGGWGVPPTPTTVPTATSTPLPTSTKRPSATPLPTPTGTLPTPTPGQVYTPTPIPGAARFDPVADTYLDQWAPTTNYASSPKLIVRQGDIKAPLIRFDLTSLPPNAVIDRAILSLSVLDRTNPGQLTVTAYKVLRSWDEQQCTWQQAAEGQAWTLAGCNDPSRDRSDVVADEVTLTDVGRWYDLDLTSLVQDWVRESNTNQGLVLKGSGSASVEYGFYSSNHSSEAMRPRLMVVWHGPAPTPTGPPLPTPTVTETSTPGAGPTPSGTPKPEPTLTPTQTLLPSDTPKPEPTLTPSETLLPTDTPTPGPTLTPSQTLPPSETPFPNPTQVRLREGASYSGVVDTFIDAWYENRNYLKAVSISARQGSIKAPLIRFDLAGIPDYASVKWSKLYLYITTRSNPNPLTLSVVRVNRAWDPAQVTWDQATASEAWVQAGAGDVESDRSARVYTTCQVDEERRWISLDVTDLVQEWVADPEHNYGLLVLAESNVAVQYDFTSSGWFSEDYRPYLDVEYVPLRPSPTLVPSDTPTITPPPTKTPTPTSTPFPPQGKYLLQQGREGYAGFEDTFVDRWNPQTNYLSSQRLVLRQGGVRSVLLRLDLAALPVSSRINEARLYLYARSSSGPSELPVRVFGVTRPWKAREVTYQRASKESAWSGEGLSGAGTDIAAQAEASGLLTTTGWISFDITNLVQHWVTFPEKNNGLVVKAEGQTSVEYEMVSSEFPLDGSLRPKLYVDWKSALPTPTVTGTPPTPTPTRTLTPTRTNTPTPTPTRKKARLTFQQGLANYQGVADTYIDSWHQASNMGQGITFSVRQPNIQNALLRYDLSTVPGETVITEATLNLWVTQASNPSSLTLQAFMLRRPWDEDAATWLEAQTGSAWGKPGAEDSVEDREAEPMGEVQISGASKWASIDITRMVQYWVQHPKENYGLLLKGVGGTSVEYQFASSQWLKVQQRPKLLVSYEPERELFERRMVSIQDLAPWLLVVAGTLGLVGIFVGRRLAAYSDVRDKVDGD